ncbi:carbon starvation protein A [bacterium]|nr:carbon starvation protein A [bacterium]MBU1651570.1 carbon starvation protein A [bacterium]MBU1881646.1 carbon starvation protein A [bacterium]
MSAILIVLISAVLFFTAYLTYGRYIAGKLGLDPSRKTPAHELQDGVDYVPAKAPVLLGHHFASIAGAGPIVGPIFAAAFGWLPVLLWIVIGGIFIGAVHDFSSLVASLRHRGLSIGEVIEEQIGPRGKFFFLIFAWSALVLVAAVFTIIVAKTFVSVPSAGTSSILFIILALIFGVSVYNRGVSLLPASVIGVILLFGCLLIGLKFPLNLSYNTWVFLLLGYIFVASVTPVWVLLQPRDYLNSFLLYAVLIAAVTGLFISAPKIKGDLFYGFHVDSLGYLFPVLFVTVACGAISGFHSMVASGTTAKQLDRESDAKLIGYGGMLIESLLAVIALLTAVVMVRSEYLAQIQEAGPVAVFSTGVGSFMTSLGIPFAVGSSFVALAVSAFALTSLDTATRLGRFALQELFSAKASSGFKHTLNTNRFLATFITVGVSALMVFSGSGMAIWPIFGSANQLLAALAFLAIAVWMVRQGKSARFAFYPMIFMFAVTVTALWQLIFKNFQKGDFVLSTVGTLLLILAVFLAIEGFRSVKLRKRTPSHVKVE